MELKTAMLERRSIRGFHQRPVEQEILRNVLQLAGYAVSANNVQPWEFAVVTGKALDQIRKANMDDLHRGAEMDYLSANPDGVYKERGRAVGKQLYAAMEIAREDKAKRAWWLERGYRFFDAPAAIFLCMDRALDTELFRFDMGCVAQNICLAAMEFGLGTCVEDQAINYQRGLRECLDLPADKLLVTGIAIGYPDNGFPANQVRTQRADVDCLTTWSGF